MEKLITSGVFGDLGYYFGDFNHYKISDFSFSTKHQNVQKLLPGKDHVAGTIIAFAKSSSMYEATTFSCILLLPCLILAANIPSNWESDIEESFTLPLGGPNKSAKFVTVDRRKNLSPEEFYEQYAKKGIPVVVTDVMEYFPGEWKNRVRTTFESITINELRKISPDTSWGIKGSIDVFVVIARNIMIIRIFIVSLFFHL